MYFNYNFRAIDGQVLVGNVGGCIGLYLGYSLLQIPDLIIFLAEWSRKFISERRSKPTEVQLYVNKINALEASPKNMLSLKVECPEIDANDTVAQKVNKLVDITLKMNETMNELINRNT